jgi:hypothetical protein
MEYAFVIALGVLLITLWLKFSTKLANFFGEAVECLAADMDGPFIIVLAAPMLLCLLLGAFSEALTFIHCLAHRKWPDQEPNTK